MLFIFIAPIGLYGILRRNTALYKKVLAVLLFLGVCLLYITLLIVSTIDSTQLNSSTIIDSKVFNEVEKIEVSDSVEVIDVLAKLESFQVKWADSVVKSWKGEFIINYSIAFPDSILFELSKGATEIYNSNLNHALPTYQSDYENQYLERFKSLEKAPTSTVFFIPNSKLKKIYDTDEWENPILLNTGLKIYEGNKYYKSYLGTLKCIYKDDSRHFLDGNEFCIVQLKNGSTTKILRYELSHNYWIKRTDPNINITQEIIKCF